MYDFFICHASEDKELIARPLHEALQENGMKSFLDEKYIKLGDSFVRKINGAIGVSKYFVILLSLNSYKKAWPVAELSSAIAMDISGQRRVIPIIIGGKTVADTILQALPLLADRRYLDWNGDANHAAEELKGLLSEA